MVHAIPPVATLTKWRASLFAHGFKASTLAKSLRRRKLTYLVRKKLRRLAEALYIASRAAEPGCYIEAGVALGGTAIFIAKLRPKPGVMKLFDVFGMIPPPGAADGEDVHARYAVIREGRSSGIGGDPYYGYADNLHDIVVRNIASFGIDLKKDRVELHQGKFEDAMQINEPVRFAHIDCDWHDSVLTCINRIWPNLILGGVMVFDDYHDYSGCKSAVDGFLKGNDQVEILFDRPSLAIRKIGGQNFNCATQDEIAWHQRADVAIDLIQLAMAEASIESLADLGCGDQKLKAAIERRGLALRYKGFDLVPQTPDVSRLDLQADGIPENFDVAVLLGVLEYIPNIVAVLRKVRSRTPYLVVSHVAPDLYEIPDKTRKQLNWRTVLTKAEFESRLADAGYAIVEARITPDNLTRVWLCRAIDAA